MDEQSNIVGFSMFNTTHPFYLEFIRSLNLSWREGCDLTYPGPAVSLPAHVSPFVALFYSPPWINGPVNVYQPVFFLDLMVIDVSVCAPTTRFTLKIYSLSPLFLDLLSPSLLTSISLHPFSHDSLPCSSLPPSLPLLISPGPNAAVVGADV